MLRHESTLLLGIVLFTICTILCIVITFGTFRHNDNDSDPIYMICDVYDTVENGEQVLVDIKLPNGELLTKQLSVNDDLPEEFEEVVIKTSDLDDYATYKIVGMR